MASEVPVRLHNVTIFPIDSGVSDLPMERKTMVVGLMVSKGSLGAFFDTPAEDMMRVEKAVDGKSGTKT